jgi:hypothetical protein
MAECCVEFINVAMNLDITVHRNAHAKIYKFKKYQKRYTVWDGLKNIKNDLPANK